MTLAHLPGSTIVVRTVTGGQVRWASAAVAVRDDAEWIAFYSTGTASNKVTAGAAVRGVSRRERELLLRQELLDRRFPLVDRIPDVPSPSLIVTRPGDWFSVRWKQEGSGWVAQYVNVCTPFVRTPIGFDTDDLCLDVVLRRRESGGGYEASLKDEEDLFERAALGLYSSDEVARIRAVGVRAAGLAGSGAPPFDEEWANWRLPLGWTLPTRLPDRWSDHLPACE